MKVNLGVVVIADLDLVVDHVRLTFDVERHVEAAIVNVVYDQRLFALDCFECLVRRFSLGNLVATEVVVSELGMVDVDLGNTTVKRWVITKVFSKENYYDLNVIKSKVKRL